ncbi:MAG: UDP-N-acetylglucosamine 1-carboxyvinyltransferase [Bacteroidia bacterium]|nr:UDP-N-acetylglucosamine 1-carboxyvinyltransferase [Bacteroidia bacterium]
MQTGECFIVRGGVRLSGEIRAQGAKNEALQVLAAALLTDETVTIENVPDMLDVRRMAKLLERLGANVERPDAHTYRIRAADLRPENLYDPETAREAKAIRGSILVLGPLLARTGRAFLPRPGGDKIGRRRLDTHILGFTELGAAFNYDPAREFYTLSGKLKGKYILLDEASVTGTANLIMAAALAEGTTVVYNAACEPYVQQLCKMLIRMGAQIAGVGSNLLTIHGVERLGGTQHTLLADMIEVGSFIGAALMTRGELTIKDADVEHLGVIPMHFRRLGAHLEIVGNDVRVPAQERLVVESYIDGAMPTISDHTWPGLTPDLLSVFLVVATRCKGAALIHQKMFESRLFFTDKLIDMGAKIILCDPHRAVVIGDEETRLRGISMTSPDIRAGVALLIAALAAEGKSVIYNIEQIDRGYERIDERLNAVGADIVRQKI